MATATMTSKGQITVPAAIRSDLDIHAGDKIQFIKIGEGRYEILPATDAITKLKGLVKTQKVVSIEKMNEAIRSKSSQ
ncbi:MAG: AbrB/MazE/SpoVT family DNA-binding domain-containing protein [Cellvibrionales bacterium]|jgi:antitoxin PrlF|nr:AbrB/MazE/SpoVT family DNA-binding domain-containing protein [Cellvibrionales bacterium]MBT5922735.1 AbrB/MazE/SpoVT family DNA-binding domain-containing protein [Cellvibrionales bacterium]